MDAHVLFFDMKGINYLLNALPAIVRSSSITSIQQPPPRFQNDIIPATLFDFFEYVFPGVCGIMYRVVPYYGRGRLIEITGGGRRSGREMLPQKMSVNKVGTDRTRGG